MEVIEERAARLNVPQIARGQQWHAWEERGRLVFQDETGLLDLPLPALPGPHQIENAGAALAALRALGHDEAACEGAMRNVRWPARMQRLTRGPLREAAPDAELWLDGGHNPHAAQAIAATLAGLPPRPTHLVFALLDNRSPADFLAPLLPHLAGLRAVSIPGEPKSTAPEVLAARARALGIQAEVAPDVPAAVAEIAGREPKARILICGSLYQAGGVLRENG